MLDLLYDLEPVTAVLKSLFPQSTGDSISLKEFKSLLVEVGGVPSGGRRRVVARRASSTFNLAANVASCHTC
jgi:hypothetical protein